VIVAIELNIALNTLEQRRTVYLQLLEMDARQAFGYLMFYFQPVTEWLRSQHYLDLEDLKVATLPTGQSTWREDVRIGNACVAGEQAAQGEYDFEHRRLSNAARPEQQGQLLEGQLKV